MFILSRHDRETVHRWDASQGCIVCCNGKGGRSSNSMETASWSWACVFVCFDGYCPLLLNLMLSQLLRQGHACENWLRHYDKKGMGSEIKKVSGTKTGIARSMRTFLHQIVYICRKGKYIPQLQRSQVRSSGAWVTWWASWPFCFFPCTSWVMFQVFCL